MRGRTEEPANNWREQAFDNAAKYQTQVGVNQQLRARIKELESTIEDFADSVPGHVYREEANTLQQVAMDAQERAASSLSRLTTLKADFQALIASSEALREKRANDNERIKELAADVLALENEAEALREDRAIAEEAAAKLEAYKGILNDIYVYVTVKCLEAQVLSPTEDDAS